jgi:GNAT superfamily N-acetyltransferase
MESHAFRYPFTADDVARLAADPLFVGLVAEWDGELVGRAGAGFSRSITPEGDMRCLVYTVPEARRQGVGQALWGALLEALGEWRPVHLRANGSPDDMASAEWAGRRGFEITQHLKHQHRDLSGGFDTAPFHAELEKAAARGFRFVPFAEVQTPETERRIHQLFCEFETDTPDGNEKELPSFEKWKGWALEAEGAWTEGWVVALAPGGDWAGFTMTHRNSKGSDRAHVYMTGIARAYRGQGLAVPMRVMALQIAAHAGITSMTTLNHAANAPMLAVNRRLGFVVDEEIYRLVKQCEWR